MMDSFARVRLLDTLWQEGTGHSFQVLAREGGALYVQRTFAIKDFAGWWKQSPSNHMGALQEATMNNSCTGNILKSSNERGSFIIMDVALKMGFVVVAQKLIITDPRYWTSSLSQQR